MKDVQVRMHVTRGHLFYTCLFLFLMVGALVPLWVTSHFPSQNGPWYLLAAQMMKEYGNPQLGYAEYYALNWHPIPHMLHTLLVYSFSHVAPILLAQKLALSTYVVLLPLSIFYFLSVAAPDKKVLGYFAFLMVHNFTFYRGYHNFSLSIPLFFFTFGYWIHHREHLGVRHLAGLAVLVVLTYLAHLFAFLLVAFSIGWYELVELRSLKKALRSALLVTWPGWLLVAHFAVLNSQVNTWVDTSEREWLLPHTSVEYFVRKFFYTTSIPVYVIGAACFLWIVFLMARRLMTAVVAGREGLRQAMRAPLLTLVLVLIVIYFFLPWKFLNWHYISARAIPFIIGLSLAAVGSLPDWRRPVPIKAAFVASICAAAFAVNVLMAREVVRLEGHIQQYTSGIAHFEGRRKLLPIHLENPPFGQIRPLTRAHEYYQITKGGANGYGAAYFNTLVPLRYRSYPIEEAFPKYDSEYPERAMKRIAETCDYVLLWGTGAALKDRLQDHGFHCVHHEGKLALYGKGRHNPQRPVGSAFADLSTKRSRDLRRPCDEAKVPGKAQ